MLPTYHHVVSELICWTTLDESILVLLVALGTGEKIIPTSVVDVEFDWAVNNVTAPLELRVAPVLRVPNRVDARPPAVPGPIGLLVASRRTAPRLNRARCSVLCVLKALGAPERPVEGGRQRRWAREGGGAPALRETDRRHASVGLGAPGVYDGQVQAREAADDVAADS